MKVIIFSHGAYSDYEVNAIVEWLKPDLAPEAARDQWLAMHPEQIKSFDEYAFIAWLVKEGIAQDIDAYELWTGGGYGPHDGEILHEWRCEPKKRYVPDEPPDGDPHA